MSTFSDFIDMFSGNVDNTAMTWLNLGSLAGWCALAALAWLVGGCRRPVPWRTVRGGTALVFVLGGLVFLFPPTRTVLLGVNDGVLAALEAGLAGSQFVFGPLAMGPGQSTASGEPSIGFVLATQALPAVIFFAGLMAVLYHLRLVQPVVRMFAVLFRKSLGLSGVESLAGASNIFVGVESAATVRPYLGAMTRSELLTLVTCGMSTVASSTLALYVLFLKDSFPLIAGHVISASVLSIPTAAMVSKLLLPETEQAGSDAIPEEDRSGQAANPIAALSAGAMDGLKLAAGIATLLIAVLGLVALVDLALGLVSLDLGRLLSWLFTPLAWLMGIDSGDLPEAARLLGERAVMTEVVAYRNLGELAAAGSLSPRTILVLSYALCGFAHLASVGIFIGGISALAPERREDLAALAWRALVGATLATLMTGALAGIFYFGQGGILGL